MLVLPYKEGHFQLVPGKLGGGNLAKLSIFPGYHRWLDRTLIVRTIGAGIDYIEKEWPDAQWEGEAEKIREEYLAGKLLGMRTAEEKALPFEALAGDQGFDYHRQPMAHQRKGFLLSRDKTVFALFCEQGTGKTKIVLDTAVYLYEQKLIDAICVVAWPNGVHRNWVDYECPLDIGIPYKAAFWASNHATKGRINEIDSLMDAEGIFKVFTFNVEAFTSPHARQVILEFLKKHRCLLVIDQSASIKNPLAKRTKFLIDKCSCLAPYRRVMDGAPVAEGADELYSQFKFLDPWIIGHDTWTGFKAEYCQIGFFNEIRGYKNLDQLRTKIDGYCFRVLAADCQDLPPRIYKKWSFDLSKDEQRIFDDLRKKDLAYFKMDAGGMDGEDSFLEHIPFIQCNGQIRETLAMVKNLRLQQISSGWWPEKEDFKPIEIPATSRLIALMNLLKSFEGEKALIFSRFRADLDLIQQTLGKAAVSYHGGVGEEDRAFAKRKFMEDPKTLYFVGQPATAGLGHTLTAASHVVFYSNHPSLRLREECEKRAHRQGQKSVVHIWDLVASRTQDNALIRALREKKEISNLILEDPDAFFLNHE